MSSSPGENRSAPEPPQERKVRRHSGWQHWHCVDSAPDPYAYVRFLEESRGAGQGACLDLEQQLNRFELRPGEAVLDVGCGLGNHLRSFARRVGPAGRVVGLDNSLTLLLEAKTRLAELEGVVELHCGDAQTLPFSEPAFDFCFSTAVLMHLADPALAIREMARVTRPGGRVVVRDLDWDLWTIDSAQPELTRRILGAFTATVRQPDVGRRLPGLLAQAGLERIEVHPLLAPHFGAWTPLQERQAKSMAMSAAFKGLVSSEEAESWCADLAERAAQGRYFELRTIIGAVGYLPPTK